MREYVPGDRIEFDIEVMHKVNIRRAVATVGFQGSEPSNMPEIVVEGVVVNTYTQEDGKHTTIRFVHPEVGINIHPGGEYRLTSVCLESYGGRAMDLADIPGDTGFLITSGEPLDQPSFADITID